ncbi:MAG: RecQ family ATP-dependent DNA helicase [Candidatus Kerfeldbacteria bacterium]|nr:RecQ family ATP-dependent DNA helicase [Candidatus Kerfeldbacteria bacterium]
MHNALKQHFGYTSFRPLQEKIITHVLDRRDALVLMPTGGGKSLCFQLPALMVDGITVVISPLISLMKDQVDTLQANGIAAAYINSSLDPDTIADIQGQAAAGRIKILYLAPERLALAYFRDWLRTMPVKLIAIDEAHCISEWGHDFRPEYRQVHVLRNDFPAVPMIALTATATARVRQDIVMHLRLVKPATFISSFNRPNIHYAVHPKRGALATIINLLRSQPGSSAIIYCFSRKGTERLATTLQRHGLPALAYHAGLDSAERQRVQEQFIRDETRIIVATIAFGMGIDKPDVRLVIHYDLPKSVEGYYQETGRAGRDGLPSQCFLFWSYGDLMKHRFFLRDMADDQERQRAEAKLQQMVQYCEQTSCRRKFLLNYFGEEWPESNCQNCDVCLPPAVSASSASDTPFDQTLFEQLRQLRKRLADQRGVPPFVIFGDRSLQDMATYFPQRPASFAQVYGVGGNKLRDLGPIFIPAIKQYAGQKHLAEKDRPPSSAVSKISDLGPTYDETFQLVKQGLSIAAIAKKRNLAPGTILTHLEKLQQSGESLKLDHLRPDPKRLASIRHAFQKSGGWNLSPVRDIVGQDFSYDELRLARMVIRVEPR